MYPLLSTAATRPFIYDSPFINDSSSSSSNHHRKAFLISATGCYTISSAQISFKPFGIIEPYGDEYDELIKALLYPAITESKTIVVVFTKEFVDSSLCRILFEEIMEYRRRKNTTVVVLAVFYVETENNNKEREEIRVVRFEEAFERMVNNDDQLRWRTAAAGADVEFSWQLSTIGGSKNIENIFWFIKRIADVDLVIPSQPVGLQFRMEKIVHLLKPYSQEEVYIVGIWGKGGIGKTTMVKFIHNNLRKHFKTRSFLGNIKNVWEQDNGNVHLQEQLIFDLSNHTEFVEIYDIKMGINKLKTTLSKANALVILDDVNDMDQLMALCGSKEWFGAGSLIFITTRYKHILDASKVNYMYEMEKLGKNESLELFGCHAFEQSTNQTNHYKDLSRKAITYCEGLPLALEVLGSFLHNMTMAEWNDILKKLEGIRSGQIEEMLKIVVDLLGDSEKDLFFNIAYFCVGKSKSDVLQLLTGTNLPVERGIDALVQRSLIKVNDINGKLDVHDVLLEIARRISPKKLKPKYIYDVFLSFRGKDTRKSFATHLYTTLKQAGIEAFMDEDIERGDNISTSLLQVIESSKISIIIFSENYSGSQWCLEELEKIMECHRTNGQVVLPIFYNVQPSDVRKKINTFGKALDEVIMRVSDNKDRWQRVLTEAANLSGWNLHDYRTEAELIDVILKKITSTLENSPYMFVAHHPVGLRSRVHDIIQLLTNKSDEIIIAGIWGMGGIGKTTMAKAIYNEIGQNFEGKCFLSNIREVWEQPNGQVHLQEQLLSGILKTRRVTLPSIELGKSILKERLCHVRALVVLDDVKNIDQLNALYGSHEWFGRGSRIIITTRDEHLLKNKIFKMVHAYNVKEMDNSESLELFSWHAFKQALPERDFIELSTRVVSCSGGLPLALEILGSYLCGREVLHWESAIKKLEHISNDQIHEQLKISYDSLSDHTEKEIFLDICCFFIGKDKNYATQILNGCGLHADIGITRLIELSLVKIDTNNKICMHDLVRNMGREIIREKSPEEPEKCTRLWSQEDVLDVLRNDIGTMAIKGLTLNMSQSNTLSLNTIVFKKMKRLRLLQFYNVKLDGEYESISKELRWLFWHGFPLQNIPPDFYQENMVVIDLKYSYLTHVWKKSQLLERMKILNLSHSHYLTETPDFSKLPNLEKLILKDCPCLSVVHPTIGDLKHIILLNFKGCKNLKNLPKSVYSLRSLKTLNISGCSKIDRLGEDIEKMTSLVTLDVSQTAIKQVPSSLKCLTSIQYVSLCGYEGLSRDVFPLISSWVPMTNNPRSFLQALGQMPYLLAKHSLFAKRSAKLETEPNKSLASSRKSPTSVDFPEQVCKEVSKNFISSLTIHVGGFNTIINTLFKSISQGWSDRGIGDYFLPGDNYPNWLNFKGQGSSVLFRVPQVIDRSLKGVIICIVYISPQDSTTSAYPVSVVMKDFTKGTIEFYKRDAATTSNDDEWYKIITYLVPGNEVEVKVDFACQLNVMETLIYLVYGEDVGKGKCIDY